MGHSPVYRAEEELVVIEREREEGMDMDVNDMYEDEKMYREYDLMESMRDMEQDQNMTNVELAVEEFEFEQRTREQRIESLTKKLEQLEKAGVDPASKVTEHIKNLLQQEKDRLAVSQVSKGMWPFQNYLKFWQEYKRDGGVDLSQEDFVDALFKLHYEDTDNITDTLKTRQKAEQMREIFDEKMASIRKPWGLTQEAAISNYRTELKEKGKDMEASIDTGQAATGVWDSLPGVTTVQVDAAESRAARTTELSGSRSDQLDKLQLKLDELLKHAMEFDYAMSIRVQTEDNPPLVTKSRAALTDQVEGAVDIWAWANIYPTSFAEKPVPAISEDDYLYTQYDHRVKMYFTVAKAELAKYTSKGSTADRDRRIWTDDTMIFMAPIEIRNINFDENDPESQPTEHRMHEFTWDNSDDGWMRLNRIGRMPATFGDVDEINRVSQYKEITRAKNAVFGASQRLRAEMNAEGKNLDGSAIPIPPSSF
jgi:hypothetical protein|tara:strand:+ start:76 stop:1518 length:1443 start_codon:yes stop_codon:yes gene_type:complete